MELFICDLSLISECTKVLITTGLHEYFLIDILNMNHLHFHLLRRRNLYYQFFGRQVTAVVVLHIQILCSKLEVKANV